VKPAHSIPVHNSCAVNLHIFTVQYILQKALQAKCCHSSKMYCAWFNITFRKYVFFLQLLQSKESEEAILHNIPMKRYVRNSDGSLMCVWHLYQGAQTRGLSMQMSPI